MEQHWLAIRIRSHPSQPVTHGDQVVVKIYFDEDPQDKSDQTTGVGVGADQYTVPSEHSRTVDNIEPTTVWCAISEDEYKASSYEVFIWADPYAIAAFSSTNVSNDLALGRLMLKRIDEVYRGPAPGPATPSAGVKVSKDRVIVHDVFLANSVVQFIVDEINSNKTASDIIETGRKLREARRSFKLEKESPTPNAWWDFSDTELEDREEELAKQINKARNVLGHRTHKNEGFVGFAQDIYFLGGGEWDHKPIIRPVWGAFNRLGNAHEVYFYDGWSNIHFGFIGRKLGLPLKTILDGAGVAQQVDNSGEQEGDDPADAQAIRAGYALGQRSGAVTRQDVVNILNQNPGWVGRK